MVVNAPGGPKPVVRLKRVQWLCSAERSKRVALTGADPEPAAVGVEAGRVDVSGDDGGEWECSSGW